MGKRREREAERAHKLPEDGKANAHIAPSASESYRGGLTSIPDLAWKRCYFTIA
jgi:hypothetical protein